MVSSDNVNYGALYSFHPDYIRHENDETPSHEDETNGTYGLDKDDSTWAGVLLILVLMLMIGLMVSLSASPGANSISRLSM
jgi:hypothetical protein